MNTAAVATFEVDPEMQSFYLKLLKGYREELAKLSNNQESQAIYEILHKIKGNGSLYGFPQLSEIAYRLMTQFEIEPQSLDLAPIYTVMDEILNRNATE